MAAAAAPWLRDAHSQLVAIMGPSGAGKTTFMNVLCGRAGYGSVRGHARATRGGLPGALAAAETGFVPQDDVVHEDLTCEENLRYSAELRLPLFLHEREAHDDFLAALDAGRIGSATLDVFRQEPLPENHPFWAHPRIMMTPHKASDTSREETIRQLGLALDQLEAGLRPDAAVDREAGY